MGFIKGTILKIDYKNNVIYWANSTGKKLIALFSNLRSSKIGDTVLFVYQPNEFNKNPEYQLYQS